MTEQPKNFGFGEDETMLKDSAAKFFADNCSADKIHSQVAEDPNIHRSIECIWDKGAVATNHRTRMDSSLCARGSGRPGYAFGCRRGNC